ncbi:DUF305 domain-containing protein [Nocardioides sp. SYSU DS0651]|uniref:DUF305 domain-containing protein n=1 Tax=Nocardioides sp. SYSU DS0651 TaxID=3415955 RepID=UPI003F4B27A8
MGSMFRATVTLVTLLLAVTACGGGDGDGGEGAVAVETARNGDVFSSADVDFATTMIPLHAEALAMVDVATGKQLSPEARALAEEIQLSSTPEVQDMTTWLTSWDRPIPETVRDHANAGHGGEDGDEQTDEHGDEHEAASEELAALEAAEGGAFEPLWVDLMTDNHEEALAAAEAEREEGTFGPAVELAESIATGHAERLETLAALGDG